MRIDLNQLLNETMDHPLIMEFSGHHPDVPFEEYKKSLSHLRQYIRDQEACLRCPGLDNCPNQQKGYESILVRTETGIERKVRPCGKLEAQWREERRKRLIKSFYIPREIIEATFDSIDPNNDRYNVICEAIDFCTSVGVNIHETKGLYLWGDFGVGKSRIAGAICNKLTEFDIDSLMVHVPELINELKGGIRDGSVNEKLDVYKKCSVLILDDIGSETMTSWVRDDIFSSILQYRMAERLPTVYTSNKDLNQLHEHFANAKGDYDELKAARIMERIGHHVMPFHVKGRNWRVGR
ncbi:primosomal protein DnaI [Laceyella putida]|uniref:Primosomal protein DnaI n=1 Tax=Laceyella putida TaxID=110101 RepID=A0ABW2RNV5_9BACL